MDDAILNGIRTYLIGNIEHWNELNCKVMPDERPEPISGKTFCSIHLTETQGTTDDQGILREIYGFGITVTKRIEAIPYDKIVDSVYLDKLKGIAPLINTIKYTVTNRWELVRAINAQLPTAETHPELFKFIECAEVMRPPIYLSRNPKLRFRDEEWFHGTHSPSRDRQDGHVGISFTLNFGRLDLYTKQTEGDC